MLCLFKNVKSFNVMKISVRYKNPAHHWSILKKKKSSSQKALDHFNDFYASIYGNTWKLIRTSLLAKKHRYIAIVNNYSDSKRTCKELECLGAISMKRIYDVNTKSFESQEITIKEKANTDNNLNKIIDFITTEKETKHSKYTYQNKNLNNMETIENKNENESFTPFQLQSIEKDVTVLSNNNRIIKSSFGLPASQLHEFIPASKIMGMDDFVLESEHYSYYSGGTKFSAQIENEDILNFPDALSIYTFESGNNSQFPKSKIGSSGLTDYFVVDSASILPILSLDLQPKDRVLDMCAAPGGKTLITLQTLIPNLIVANDIQASRIKRVNNFINQFIPNIDSGYQKLIITMKDARSIEDKGFYNKVLVDVPCTTDRHVLHEDNNNIFKGTRIKERLRIPEIQTEILLNALKLVTYGGTVVYSTCTLSPIQNDGVVQMALKKVHEECNIAFVVKNQTQALVPLKDLYTFGNFGLKYGHLVIPTKNKNCGPIYFCKMVRIK